VTLSLILVFVYEWHVLVVAWAWWVKETFIVIARTFVIRRTMRPVWKMLTDFATIFVLGFALAGRIRRAVAKPFIEATQHTRHAWDYFSWHGRALMVASGCTVLVFVGWVTYELPILIPLAAGIVPKLYYWAGDRVFDKWAIDIRMRYRIRRFIRKHPPLLKIFRFVRRPIIGMKKSAEERAEILRPMLLSSLGRWMNRPKKPEDTS